MRFVFVILMFFASFVLADELRPTSLHHAPMVACQSFTVGIRPDVMKKMLAELRGNPVWDNEKQPFTPLDYAERNQWSRDILEKYVSRSKRNAVDLTVVQFYFEFLRPDLAFDWLEIELPNDQREKLQSIKLPNQLKKQIAMDRLVIIRHVLKDKIIANAKTQFGDPVYFGNREPIKDLDVSGDLEAFHLLASAGARRELKTTIGQNKEVELALKDYRERELLFDDEMDMIDLPEEEIEKLREEVLKKARSILNEDQKVRFEQLLCQWYLRWNSTIGPRLLTKHLGEYDDGIDRDLVRLPVEIQAMRQLRVVQFVKDEVEKITKRDMEKYTSPPAFRSTITCNERPKLDNPVAMKLNPKRSSPRRSSPRRSR